MKAAVYIVHHQVPSWDFGSHHATQLREEIPGLEVVVCHDEAEFLAALPTAQVAMVWRFRQAWVAHAAELRLLMTPAAGRDYFHVTLPPSVETAYGHFHGAIMAETVVGMLLGMCRGILPAATCQTCAAWPRGELAPRMKRLHGSHVAILGFGHIGQQIARLLKPFGARLTAIRRSTMVPPAFFGPADAVVTAAELDHILPTVDHLVLCLPGTPATDRLLDRRQLALLPPTATVCNIGRGNAVDEQALMDALRARRLGGACLDVFQEEPLPLPSPLRTCPNLWLMPHAAAISPDYLDLFIAEFGQRWRTGEFRIAQARE